MLCSNFTTILTLVGVTLFKIQNSWKRVSTINYPNLTDNAFA